MFTYERKTPVDLDCGITVYMQVLGAKWKPCIIDLIHKGYQRPSEIHRLIPEATPRVLDMQLREMEAMGLVQKGAASGFPLRTHYSLTDLGLSLIPLVAAIDDWGKRYGDQVKQHIAEAAAYTE
ncbi:winged helix-turn-helix transcriptional regulator [Chitinophaga qingshengii]|uniref:Helix-turn-helix transcriptional regulator n=1 Tax=Chitinophaga qingshengii TaxID=1569794 RepID=A0ABR7TT70_9BACT|nr:helix-turn-helix domain-containing protein [Chitinophaga qingshengii]MBC9932817.1 helix-turn-helix transcriptional regulator [Chitinophaga qingshengii]